MPASSYAARTTAGSLRLRRPKSLKDNSRVTTHAQLAAELSEQDAFERELLKIWLDWHGAARRRRMTPSFQPVATITWANSRMISRLLRTPLFYRPILRRFTLNMKARLFAFFLGRLALEFIPILRAHLNARLLDLLQESLNAEPYAWIRALTMTAFDLCVRSLQTVIREGHNHNHKFLRTRIKHNFERDLMASSTCLSLRAYACPAVRDIGEAAKMDRFGYFSAIEDGLFQIPTQLAALVAQVYILIGITFSGTTSLSWREWLTRALLIFIPLLFRQLIRKMRNAQTNLRARKSSASVNAGEGLRYLLNGDRKEFIVFGCRLWTQSKMEKEFEDSLAQLKRPDPRAILLSMGEDIAHTITDKLFEFVVASRMLGYKPSIGSITMSRNMMENVCSDVGQLQKSFRTAYASIFNFAAYLLAIRLGDHPPWIETLLTARDDSDSHQATQDVFRPPPKGDHPGPSGVSEPPRIDYDSVRSEGMCIEARNLGFRYPGSVGPTLKGVNLRIEAGETLAIVGYNGGGKSTLLQVLFGLWGKPDEGQLLFNGIPIEQYDPNSLHARSSCLFQDFRRYNESLRVNLGLKPQEQLQDDAELKIALNQGGAKAILDKVGLDGRLHPWLVATNKLPALPGRTPERSAVQTKKDSTLAPARSKSATCSLDVEVDSSGEDEPATSLFRVGKRKLRSAFWTIASTLLREKVKQAKKPVKASDNRMGLSEGQWQRVALSRAFYYSERADLIAFDEPSAALDPEAEIDLFQRIHALSRSGGRKRTIIYISHRFSTVRKADKIAFVENGTVTEFGPHAELMRLGGRYHKLFTLQKGEWGD